MGEIKNMESILKEHPFFKAMPPAQLKLLAGCAANVRFEPGEMITRSNELADKFYIIREGRVAIEVNPAGRGAIIIETLADGDLVGWSWLFPPYTWNLDARALEGVKAISLDGKCLRGKMDKDHDLGYEMLTRFARVMLDRIHGLRDQLIQHV